MYILLVLLGLLYGACSVGATFAFYENTKDSEEYEIMFYSPKEIYDRTEMNMFGCIMCSFLYFLFTPLYCVPVTIGWCIYKLCHVGRRD